MKKILMLCVFFMVLQNSMASKAPFIEDLLSSSPGSGLFSPFELLNAESYTTRQCEYIGEGKYIGGIKQNKRNGKGILVRTDGIIMQGHWKNDVFLGCGMLVTMMSAGRIVYKGDFANNFPNNGIMVVKFANGDLYKGIIANDFMLLASEKKQAVLLYATGDTYVGNFKESALFTRKGVGRYIYKNGTIYIGDWVDNKKHGNGIEITNDNQYFKVEYDQDICVKRIQYDEDEMEVEKIRSDSKKIVAHMQEQKELFDKELQEQSEFLEQYARQEQGKAKKQEEEKVKVKTQEEEKKQKAILKKEQDRIAREALTEKKLQEDKKRKEQAEKKVKEKKENEEKMQAEKEQRIETERAAKAVQKAKREAREKLKKEELQQQLQKIEPEKEKEIEKQQENKLAEEKKLKEEQEEREEKIMLKRDKKHFAIYEYEDAYKLQRQNKASTRQSIYEYEDVDMYQLQIEKDERASMVLMQAAEIQKTSRIGSDFWF